MKRLAEGIEALAAKDDEQLKKGREIAQLRCSAALELYRVCADFVRSLNDLLSQTKVTLDPPVFGTEAFQEDGTNLIQINVRGRILQIAFRTTDTLVSTEEFRVPYTMEGSVRCFNQQLLDQDLIEEQLLFYCLEKPHYMWRFFDARTYRSGPFDRDYLVGLMEQLI